MRRSRSGIIGVAVRTTSLLSSVLILTIACRADISAPQPEGPLQVPERAIALSIDVGRAAVSQVSVPASSTSQTASASVLGSSLGATITNVSRSSPAFGRVRVTFDLALTNLFSNVDLVPSTFPVPPTAQVVAYPFSTSPAGILGLKVIPTTEWDGNLWNFFNDPVCIALAPPSDCYRWEPFGAQILAGATTSPHRVGFDVDATVTTFTVYIAVAADYRERAATPQPPIMSLSELDQIFTATVGGDRPQSRTIQVTNIGGGSLDGLSSTISYQNGATGWLAATLSATTAPATITLQPTTTGLQPGTYLARLSVASASATNSPQSVTVALIVNAPAFNLSPSSVQLRGAFRGPALTQQLLLTSAGPSQVSGIELTVVSAEQTWLHATLSATTTPATISLTADPGELAAGGPYFAEVKLTGAGGASTGLVVVLTVHALPDLTFVGNPTVTTGPVSVNVSGLTVANQGYLDAGPFNVGICISPTQSIDDCMAEAFVTRTGLLISSTDVLPNFTITSTEAKPVPPGTYYLFAVVDPPYTAMVEESYETNNVLALGPIVIPPSSP